MRRFIHYEVEVCLLMPKLHLQPLSQKFIAMSDAVFE